MLHENVRLAFVSMAANKLRTFLTMLGIIIGIAAVIAIMTVGNTLMVANQQQMATFGVNNVECYIGGSDSLYYSNEDFDWNNFHPAFTEDMLRKMIAQFPEEIEAVGISAYGQGGKATVQGKNQDQYYANVSMVGINPGYMDVNSSSMTITAGRNFRSNELTADSWYCLVDQMLVSNLFDGDAESAVGKKITVSLSDDTAYEYTIVGVYSSNQMQFADATSVKDMQTNLIVPFQNAKAVAGEDSQDSFNYISDITILTKTGTDVISFTTQLQDFMNSQLPSDTLYQVSCYNNAEWIEESNKSLRQMTLAITAIGAIALLVGGIGVMNIMTVSIMERTREIGTRKALGARNSDIRLQFITEAILICLLGGIIGIAAGLLIGYFACTKLLAGYTVTISWMSVWAAFGISFAIGVFFGFYPANKAARMDPIEALRYE
jgi:putative ABC transport system permease protein